jgi:hypothetical protein
MKVTGYKIPKMEMVLRHGPTVPDSKVNIQTERKKVSVNFTGQREATFKANLLETTSKETESIRGQTEEFTRVSGLTIK